MQAIMKYKRGALAVYLTFLSCLAQNPAVEEPKSDETSDATTAQAKASILHDGEPLATLDTILLDRASRGSVRVAAVENEQNIARMSARILGQSHYLLHPLDDELSKKFYHHYIESLDNLHMHFTQEDLDEFSRYETELDDRVLSSGDTTPARKIFERFMERVEQRASHVNELLKSWDFEFEGDDRYDLNRREAPWPGDLDEAKRLWEQHLRYEVLQERLNDQKPEDIQKSVSRRYARLLRSLGEFDGNDLLRLYLTAMGNAYDPHSDYMDGPTLENFAIGMQLSLFGIGAVLQSEDGYCKVKELIAGGPAETSKKVKPNDRIVEVAQGEDEFVDVVDMKLSRIVEKIRGPKGTKVRLRIIPADATDPSKRVVVSLIRDEIRLENQEAKAQLIDLQDSDGKTVRLGLIDLPSFYAKFDLSNPNGDPSEKSTTKDVVRLLDKMKKEGAQGMILDLRRNGGGSLEEAIHLTGLFIKTGPVVQVKDPLGNVAKDLDEDPAVAYDGPLVVLTSRFSASASEILAGALQDYGRALIVGDSSTHGKGTVQSLVQLKNVMRRSSRGPDPGALKFTVRKFYRASGESTQLKGVTPDIVLPSVNNYAEVGESSLEDPLAWDTIPSADFDKLDRIQPILPELRRRSNERVESDPDFAYIMEDIQTYKDFLADRSVSLNEEVRRKEKAENEARAKARKEERKERSLPEEIVYEIKLKDVDLAGLPQPVDTTVSTTKVADEPAASESDEEESEELEAHPAVDPTLNETKRILLDLIRMSGSRTEVAVTR